MRGRVVSPWLVGLFLVSFSAFFLGFVFSHNSIERVRSWDSSRTILATDSNRQAEEGLARGVSEAKTKVPRRNLKGETVPAIFDPTNRSYWESLGIIAAPCIIIAVLCCFFGSIFYIMRGCCNCFGGKEPKPGGYTLRERFIPKQLLLATAIIVIFASVFGFIGNGRFSQGTNEFFGTIIKTQNSFESITLSVKQDLTALQRFLGNQTVIDQIFQALENGNSDFRSVIDNAYSQTKRIDRYRSTAIIISFVLGLVTSFCGVVGALLNKGTLCLVMGILGIFALFFLWISFGIHLPISIALADFCVAVQSFLESPTIEIPTGLDVFFKCIQNNTYELPISVAQTQLNEQLEQANNYTLSCCGFSITLENITQVNSSTIPTQFREDFENAQYVITIFDRILHHLEAITNCSLVRDGFNGLQFSLCVTLLRGTDLIMSAQGGCAIVLIPGCILAIIGWKRFPNPAHKHKKKDVEQVGNEYDYEENYDETPHKEREH